MQVKVCRDGYIWEMDFINGVPTSELKKGEKTNKTGTTVTFWANEDIFWKQLLIHLKHYVQDSTNGFLK